MKVLDLTVKATIEDGKHVNLVPGGQPMTWAEVAYDALMYPAKRVMDNANVQDKRVMFGLASRIKGFPKSVTLQPNEFEMVVVCIGEKNIPAVLGAFEAFCSPALKAVQAEEKAGER